jgi:hypothetical protein
VNRDKGLWVVLSRGPGPNSDFVELEDEQGRGHGPLSGIEWHQEGPYWILGPFVAARRDLALIKLSEAMGEEPATIEARYGEVLDVVFS